MKPKSNAMEEKATFRKICQHCGREFTAYSSVASYCSTRCANLADKLRKRNERLKETSLEVRETQRLALLDKNYLTLSDAARLLQLSRNTLYKIIRANDIKLLRLTNRTIRIAREDIEKVSENRTTLITASVRTQEEDLGRYMTREQVMQTYNITYSWFYSVLKKRGIKTRMIGTLGFYDKDEMHKAFANHEYQTINDWYTFEELRRLTGMSTESISTYCKDHKIARKKTNGITYVAKDQWDEARGSNLSAKDYYTVKQLTEKYKISRNQLFCVLQQKQVSRIKRGNFVYFAKEDADAALSYRLSKIQ